LCFRLNGSALQGVFKLNSCPFVEI